MRRVIPYTRCPMLQHSRFRRLRCSALTALCCALCLTLAPAVVMGQKADKASGEWPKDQRSQLLVTPSWLAAHINDPNLVLLQVGDAEEYMNEHIPGARLASLRVISRSD